MSEQENKEQVAVSNEQDELSDEQLKGVAGGVRPPSGDSNPSDLFNHTVNTDEVISPESK